MRSPKLWLLLTTVALTTGCATAKSLNTGFGDVGPATFAPAPIAYQDDDLDLDEPIGPVQRKDKTSLRGGLGLTGDPDLFLMAIMGEYFLTDHVAIGPQLQFGIADDELLLAPTLGFRAVFDLDHPDLTRLKPFAQAGLGMIYLEKDRRGDDDEIGFLMNFGGGVDFMIDEKLSVGSTLLFNVMPDDVLDENFIVSWQIATFGVRF